MKAMLNLGVDRTYTSWCGIAQVQGSMLCSECMVPCQTEQEYCQMPDLVMKAQMGA